MNSVCRFESDNDGVLFTPAILERVEYHEGYGNWLLENVSDLVHIKVLRHPDILDGKLSDIESRLFDLTRQYVGKSYPHSVRPALAAAFFFRWIAYVIAWLISKCEPHKFKPGPFCSELVTRFYTALNIQLFDREVDPTRISPNDLMRSRLVAVPGVTCMAVGTVPNNELLCRDLNSDREHLARENTRAIVVGGDIAGRVDDLLAVLDNTFKALSEPTFKPPKHKSHEMKPLRKIICRVLRRIVGSFRKKRALEGTH